MSAETKMDIHTTFCNLTSYERKKDFVYSNIKEEETKKFLVANESKENTRKVARTYYLPVDGKNSL